MLEFKGGSISQDDWKGMETVLDGVTCVLEFGSGISTKLFNDRGIAVTSCETDYAWIQKARPECFNVEFIHWNNRTLSGKITGRRYDLAFVDGQDPRDKQITWAMKLADKILLHDGHRAAEQALVEKYLSGWTEIPIPGRCRYFERAGAKYASLVSCTKNYTQYLNAQLNSMDAVGMTHYVHVLAIDMDEDYLKKIEDADWTFNLTVHRFSSNDFAMYGGDRDAAQKSRYATLPNFVQYDALLLLDVDMLIVKNLTPYFDMVQNTDYIIGCNERFKWQLEQFVWEGKQLPKMPMDWMICNSPLFFDPKQNMKFIDMSRATAKRLVDQEGKRPADLYTMNVALWLAGITDKVIALPNYVWTGVHNGYIQIFTRIQKINKREWRSFSGEPVYIIHGRWDGVNPESWYLAEQQKRYDELMIPAIMQEKLKRDVQSTIKQIKDEFVFFNTQCKCVLED